MSNEIDERGKYYTDVIQKEPLRVSIRTSNSRIDGTIHIRPMNRLLDELNQGDASFIAVTQAKVLADGIAIQVPFLALRKGTIEWIGPDEEETEGNS
jgi:hypothetical protein